MTTTGESPPFSTPETDAESGPDAALAAPRPFQQFPRKGPALIFLAVVAVVSLGGFLLAALSSSPKTPPAPLGQVAGSKVAAASASSFISKIAVAGEPPANVTEALVVPAGSTLISSH